MGVLSFKYVPRKFYQTFGVHIIYFRVYYHLFYIWLRILCS